MEKIKAIFDNRATWVALAAAAGAVGEHYASVVNALGALVMAVL